MLRSELARRRGEPDVSMGRQFLRVAAALTVLFLLGYVGSCFLLYYDQRSIIYYPNGTHVAVSDTNFALPNDGAVLRGWRLNPGQARALIYFGGNAESLGAERDDLAALFPGRTVYLVAYRGYGASDGSPSEQALFSDALALFDAVKTKHASVAVVGRSIGSGVACFLVSQRPVERLALITPFDSLEQVAQAHYPLFPINLLAKDRYESSRYIATYRGPILVMRAGRDEIVPSDSTDRLLAAMQTLPSVLDFPSAGHNSISDDPRYASALSEFMK